MYVCWSANSYAYNHHDASCETNLTKPESMKECIGVSRFLHSFYILINNKNSKFYFKSDYHLCEFSSIFICVYLILVVITRYLQPYSEKLRKKDHANLIALFLAAGADVADFVEYSEVKEITEKVGVNSIYGKFL